MNDSSRPDEALTLGFAEVARDDLQLVGGKGANLAALTRAGVRVPSGFCITTFAFDRFIALLPNADAHFAALEAVDSESVDAARTAAASMRQALDALPVPADVARAVTAAWQVLGVEQPLAVRSSATAEDLPGASFAGQQDTYLNVRGEGSLLLTDRLRAHPELVKVLETHAWTEARPLLDDTNGGRELANAMDQFLARYGDRGASEIDISRPRWRDDPALLLRVMTGGLSAAQAGAHRRQHQAQSAAGEAAATRLVAAASVGVWGPIRRRWVQRLVTVARFGMGLREHPKFIIVQVLGLVLRRETFSSRGSRIPAGLRFSSTQRGS